MIDAEHQNQNNKLPPQVRRLVQLIGWAETYKLLKQLGGKRLRMPARLHRLVLLGEPLRRESLEALAREFGALKVDLPKLDKMLLEIRNRQIGAALEAGAAVSDIAAQYGVTDRHVRAIRATRGSVSPLTSSPAAGDNVVP